MDNTNKIQKMIASLEASFTDEEYANYLNGNITYEDLCLHMGVSQYAMKLFFKKRELLTRNKFLNNTTNHSFFDNIDNENKAYLLGLFFADGCCYGGKIRLSLTEKDNDVVELFRKSINENYNISVSQSKYNANNGYTSKPMHSVSIYSKHMQETLTKYGMGPNKTYSNTIDLSFIPENLMVHFIRGYFDGDGCVSYSNGMKNYKSKGGEIKQTPYHNYNWSIISNSDYHLKYIRDFIKSHYEINANIINDSRGHFLIEINRKSDFFKWRDILYENATYFLKRKKDKYFEIKANSDAKKGVIKINGNTIIAQYNSVSDAARAENITASGIRVRIKKEIEINGCRWKYR